MNPIKVSQTTRIIKKQTETRPFTLITTAAILFIAGSSISCSTFSGFGRDVEKVGDEIQEAAR